MSALRCECGGPDEIGDPAIPPMCLDCYRQEVDPQSRRNGPDLPDGVYATPLSVVEREKVRWLWPERIPLGMLTLLIGDPGLGKSLLSLYLASQVSRDGGDVLILSAEDHPAATIRPRAEAVGADLDRLHVVGVRRDGIEDGLVLPDNADALDRLAKAKRVRLVIVDPLAAHLADGVNSWRDQSVRRALAPLHRVAEQQSCAIVVVAHLNKAKGADPLYRTGGSIGIPAAVRSALLLARDPEDPDGERGSQRVLAHVKCNVAERAESLACRIETVQLEGPEEIVAPVLTITGTSTTTAADLLDASPADERTERDEAADFLLAELAGGPIPARDLIRAAPCGERTLRKAKAALGVEAVRVGFGASGAWAWSLPPKAAPPISRSVQPLEEPLWQAESEATAPQRLQGRTDTEDVAANGSPPASPEEETEVERIAAKFGLGDDEEAT